MDDDLKIGDGIREIYGVGPVSSDPRSDRRESGHALSESIKKEPPEPALEPPSKESLEALVEQLRSRVARFTDRVDFDFDSKRYVLEVVDRDTGEILHRFPPEETAKLGEKLEDTANLVIDRYA